MRKHRIFEIIGLFLFCLIVLLPPIIHGYVYPNIGDDAAVHLQVFDRIKDGTISNLILSYRMVGYPIVWTSNLTGMSMDALFLWFNYLSLIAIGLTIYFVSSRLISRTAGWLSLIITLFCTQSILFQFYYGQIFNAINMGVFLPLLVYFAVEYITQGRIYQLALLLVFAGLFGAFHTCGIYLPFVVGFAIVVYVSYCLLKRRKINMRVLSIGIVMVLLPVCAFLLSMTNIGELWNAVLHNLGSVLSVPLVPYLMDIVSPTLLVLVAFTVVFHKDTLKGLDYKGKIFVFLLSCMVVVLAVSAFAKLSLDPFRQALDFATTLALIIAVLVSVIVATIKNKPALVILIFAIGFGLFHNLPTWFDYNSAIRPSDKQAIAYVNTLNYGSYNCSPQVAPWIYDRFLESAKYSYDITGLLIVRNMPMTPRSDPENKWYEWHGFDIDTYKPLCGDDSFEDDYRLLETFSDGKVFVRIYENYGNVPRIPLEDESE